MRTEVDHGSTLFNRFCRPALHKNRKLPAALNVLFPVDLLECAVECFDHYLKSFHVKGVRASFQASIVKIET